MPHHPRLIPHQPRRTRRHTPRVWRRWTRVATALCGLYCLETSHGQTYNIFTHKSCLVALIRYDSDYTNDLTLREYVEALSFLSPLPDCPDLNDESNFNEDSPFLEQFVNLSCACKQYSPGTDYPGCCVGGDPKTATTTKTYDVQNRTVMLPNYRYPIEYKLKVCESFEQSLEQFCLTPTRNPSSMIIEDTVEPSSRPTASPTSLPTSVPTRKPTMAPTLQPTEEPTTAPSGVPTISVSQVPTVNPTERPTESPSRSASEVPTFLTLEETYTPTSVPSLRPTGSPHSILATAAPSSASDSFRGVNDENKASTNSGSSDLTTKEQLAIVAVVIAGICFCIAAVILAVYYRQRKQHGTGQSSPGASAVGSLPKNLFFPESPYLLEATEIDEDEQQEEKATPTKEQDRLFKESPVAVFLQLQTEDDGSVSVVQSPSSASKSESSPPGSPSRMTDLLESLELLEDEKPEEDLLQAIETEEQYSTASSTDFIFYDNEDNAQEEYHPSFSGLRKSDKDEENQPLSEGEENSKAWEEFYALALTGGAKIQPPV